MSHKRLRTLEKKSEELDRLLRTFSFKKINWVNPYSCRLLSIRLSFSLALSFLLHQRVLTSIVTSTFDSIEIDLNDIVPNIPSCATIKSLLLEIAAEVLIVMRKSKCF